MISDLHAMCRKFYCPSCRLQAYGHVNDMKEAVKDQTFKPCPACELVIERILRMEVVEETAL
jgi:NAD-dependent SIR2 family protein deacetylase